MRMILKRLGGIQSALVLIFINLVTLYVIKPLILWIIHLLLFATDIPTSFIYYLLIYPIFIILNFFILYLGIMHDSDTSREDGRLIIKFNEKSHSIKIGHMTLIFIGLSLFLVGNAIHYTANYLWFSSYFDGSHPYLTDEFLNEIYIFDELLGHWFMITGLLLLGFVLGLHNLSYPTIRSINRYVFVILIILTMFSTVVWNYFVLEGLYAVSNLVFSSLMGLYIVVLITKRVKTGMNMYSFPVSILVTFFFALNIIELLLFFILYGEFTEPHTW